MKASIAAATFSCLPIYENSLLIQCGTRLYGQQAMIQRATLAARFARCTG
jgi:hypothetical protein